MILPYLYGPITALLCMQVQTSTAQATGTVITTCPGKQTTGTAANGFTYTICPGTDYQGASDRMINNVASTTACVQLCANDTKCVKAVFDTTTSVCHLKTTTGNLVWTVNPRFNTIQVTVAAQGTTVTKCPYTESVYAAPDGITYQICAGTDLQGTSRQVIEGVASNTACNQLCDKTAGCIKTIYDNVNSVCHIKDWQAPLTWTTNRQFTTTRLNTALPATLGKWSDPIKLPVIPVAAYMVPQQPESSRMMFFSSWATNNFGGAGGLTQFGDYNYKTGAVSQRQVANTHHDMFCPGISALPDGRIVITGGANAEVTSLYDPSSNTFVQGPNMQIARGYQTSVTLSNGKIFTIGGSYSGGIGGKTGEIFDSATNKWTLLPGADVKQMLTTYDAEGEWRTDNHGWLFGWKNGAVFQAGPSRDMHWYSTTGNGAVTAAGTRDPDSDAMCGVHVMYDAVAGKIFSAGGSQSYTNSPALARAFVTTINNPNDKAVVERIPDMNYARAFGNVVVLPDGKVIVMGGQTKALVFTDTDPALTAELFDPTTKTFKRLAPAAIARNYHAVSILLPDGTVFSGGGGLCYVGAPGNSDAGCNRAVDHSDGQIFTPPYLFDASGNAAVRPTISSVSSSSATNGYKVRVGGTLTIRMNDSTGSTFSLIRMGSVTHSINSDQRRVPLTNVKQSVATYTATLPTDAGILIPGFYYLFAINKNGVPSVAKTIQVTL